MKKPAICCFLLLLLATLLPLGAAEPSRERLSFDQIRKSSKSRLTYHSEYICMHV